MTETGDIKKKLSVSKTIEKKSKNNIILTPDKKKQLEKETKQKQEEKDIKIQQDKQQDEKQDKQRDEKQDKQQDEKQDKQQDEKQDKQQDEKQDEQQDKQSNSPIHQVDPSIYDVPHPTGLGTRDKIRSLLYQALLSESPKVENDTNAQQVANAIEVQMFTMFSNQVNREYKAKYRNISFNLKDKKNGRLRNVLLDRLLSPERLLNMTSEELANDDLKKSREIVHEKMTRDAMPYNKQAATTDQFKCGKCKERKCTYYQMQTRSADEPLTTFVQCVNCGNRWRF